MRTLIKILAILAIAALTSQVMAQETRTVEVNGVTLHYVDEGQGKPVVFAPAALVDHRVWEPYR
ncbi:hypothetical protein [Aquisalimonas sp.]|uniref:hypothetical protein n=1 Tax=Aquisalimonas sp. TaxID=1872621 RepID=UPI0025C0E7F1|nr:hypothetical protein [Aquisalimonas sp.]